jgi:hypothetical protein
MPGVVVLAVECSAPYATALFDVPAEKLWVGYDDARRIAARYRECEAANHYPGPYDGQRLVYDFPAWAASGEAWTVGDDAEHGGI